jgi:hypothetical protein
MTPFVIFCFLSRQRFFLAQLQSIVEQVCAGLASSS